MRPNDHRFLTGFVAGALCATVLVLSQGALAAFVKKNWEKQDWRFQAGYISGFTDCVRVNRSMDPTGYIRKTYPLPKDTTPLMWLRGLKKFYAEKGNENRAIYQAISVVGNRLVAKKGPLKDPDPRERARRILEQARGKKNAAKKDSDKAEKDEKGGKSAENVKGSGDSDKAGQAGKDQKSAGKTVAKDDSDNKSAQ
ncbi:MAG: hypothetical protein D6815_00460 [Candidatus Dadabacteria bacterium]|nr:MAG: hypothetical protein D6815_00460 [Candidatus Dadabacteria bacterium]